MARHLTTLADCRCDENFNCGIHRDDEARARARHGSAFVPPTGHPSHAQDTEDLLAAVDERHAAMKHEVTR